MANASLLAATVDEIIREENQHGNFVVYFHAACRKLNEAREQLKRSERGRLAAQVRGYRISHEVALMRVGLRKARLLCRVRGHPLHRRHGKKYYCVLCDKFICLLRK